MPLDSLDLRLLLSNAFGLHHKFGEFRHNVISHNADIAIVTETKFSQSIADSEVYIPGYTPIRRDRNANGGGIGVWIKTEMPMKQFLDQQDDSHEILWLSVCRHHHDNTIIGTVYRPGSSAENDLTLIDHLYSRLDEVRQFGSNIIPAGDFNVHNSAWLRSTKTSAAGEALEDVCAAHHLAQHVADNTQGNNTLDFVISDFPGPVATAIHPPPPPQLAAQIRMLSMPSSPALPRTSCSPPQGRFGDILVQIVDESAISLALLTG